MHLSGLNYRTELRFQGLLSANTAPIFLLRANHALCMALLTTRHPFSTSDSLAGGMGNCTSCTNGQWEEDVAGSRADSDVSDAMVRGLAYNFRHLIIHSD